jgi:RNA polymerase sigma-70 factor (ECF subfamily)
MLVGLVEAACRSGAATWPGVEVGPDQLASFVGAPEAPEALHWDDLYLACACAQGDQAALRAFDRGFGEELDRVVQRFRAAPIAPADLRQAVLTRLFVADAEHAPRITRYRGSGSLRGWLRVTAVRACIDAVRSHGAPTAPLDADGDDPLLRAVDDVELAFLRREYTVAFKAAFELAAGQLSSRQRNLLRHVAIGGLTQEEIAAIYGVHRVTVARWLGEAQRLLCAALRGELQRRLALPDAELDSVFRAIRSQVELSLSRVLGDAGS